MSTNRPVIYLARISYPSPDVMEVHVVGDNLGAAPGAVALVPAAGGSSPTIDSWSATKIVFTVNYIPSAYKNTTSAKGAIQITTQDGKKVVISGNKTNMYGPSTNPAWTLTQTSVTDDLLTFSGTNLDVIEGIVLVELGTDEEFVAHPVTRSASNIVVKLPAPSTFDSAFIVSNNGTSVEEVLAADLDVDQGEPGYTGWVAEPSAPRVTGKGLKFSNVPSDIGQVQLVDGNGNVLYRGVASSGPSVWDPSHNTSPFVQAHYTSAALDELIVRWPDSVLPLVKPANYLEPLVEARLVDFVHSPIVLVPENGEVWEYSPTVTGLVINGDDTLTVTGTQLGGPYGLSLLTEPVGGGTQSYVDIGGYAYDGNTQVTSYTDEEINLIDITAMFNGIWGLTVPLQVVEYRLSGPGGGTVFVDDISANPVVISV